MPTAYIKECGYLGKISTIELHPDMTFREIMRKTDENQIITAKNEKVNFSLGQSVFSETGISRFKFWRRPRKIAIFVDGAFSAFNLGIDTPLTLESKLWTKAEIKKYVSQLVAKSKAEQKTMSNWQTFFLFGGMILNLVMTIVLMRSVGVF